MKNVLFTGIRSAIFTPLNPDNTVKLDAVKPLVDFTLDRGVKGFYVAGSTGEGPALNAAERMKIAEAVIDACKSRKTIYGTTPDVIVHVAAPDVFDAFKLAKHAKECGADAISSLAPNFYASHGPEEMLEYYKRLADCTDLPILIYATGLLMRTAGSIQNFMEKALEIDHIIGLKYTDPNYHPLNRIKKVNGGDINVINGPDETLLAGLAMGADGGIGSTYNLVPEKFVKIYDLYNEGKMEEARRVQTEVNDIIDALAGFKGGYGNAAKNTMRFFGIDLGNRAYPAMQYTADELAELKRVMRDAGLDI
ncbi:MAG: dihydrodipicolinate synthase family protein [Clostridia bacterium]|nr:dihydrodipicolinate synthase family protein [Clostridia bacterium]